MKLFWTTTGDELSVDIVNNDLMAYWFSEISRQNKNEFQIRHTNEQFRSYAENKEALILAVAAVNNFLLDTLRLPPLCGSETDWDSQDNLNLLHKNWVLAQQPGRNVVALLNKISTDLAKDFQNINILIHLMESPKRLEYSNSTTTRWQINNPFGPQVGKFGKWQIELHYDNLGRSNYEKWSNYDNDLTDVDTNNFTHLGGTLIFNIRRPEVQSASEEYIRFCTVNGQSAYGPTVPFGNFNLPIADLRRLFVKNSSLTGNHIKFDIGNS